MSDLNPSSIGARDTEIGSTNRGHENRVTSQDRAPIHVTLESINMILMDYLQNTIIPTITEGDQARPVPILYGTQERWAAVRKQGFLRDPQNDKLLTPSIMIRRTGERQGQLINPNNKYMYRSLSQEWNRRNSYDRFAVQNGIRPSQQIRTVMIPDYLDLTYDGVIWCEYQGQLDKVIEQLFVENQEFWGNRNNFKFRVTIEEFRGESTLPASGERIVRSQFQMKVAAYLLPERIVKNFKLGSTNAETFTKKKVIIQETIVSSMDE